MPSKFDHAAVMLGFGAPLLLWGRVAGHSDSKSIIMWAIVIAVVSTILGAVLFSIRRRTIGGKPAAGEAAGLMDELRRLKQSGQLSQDEFDKARSAWRHRAVEEMDQRTKVPNREAPPRRAPAPQPNSPEAKPAVRKVASDGAVTAAPGFDLTGAPLPMRPTPQPTYREPPDGREASDRPTPGGGEAPDNPSGPR
ncbi:MAG: hypothetical protein KF768_07895 [Phycisphaeraceae bacterium]|nr:hypothetical protein [Phycisphaeraceae bacterium]